MKKKTSGFRPLLLCSLILACNATFAATKPLTKPHGIWFRSASHNYFELIGAGSVSSVHAGSAYLPVTSNETDTLSQTNGRAWTSWGGQLGLGYVYFLGNAVKFSNAVQWFPTLEPELNVYYTNYQNKGNVYRFGSSAFNDLTYNMPVKSTRLMLDGALTVASWRRISAYVIGGVGNAWNRISYSDQDKGVNNCNDQNLTLTDRNYSHFAWETGAGVAYALNNRFRLSFQYLYTDFGRLRTSGSGNTGGITVPTLSPASFNFHTQALLLGLHMGV